MKIRPAEAYHPGEYIRDELRARKWKHADFAAAIGISLRGLRLVMDGKQSLLPSIARAIGRQFRTSAALWMGLQMAFDSAREARASFLSQKNIKQKR